MLFDIFHPGCEELFEFKNSQNHRAMASDHIVANRLNLSDGSQSSAYAEKDSSEHNGKKIEQDMQFEDYGRHNVEVYVQKGIRRIFI